MQEMRVRSLVGKIPWKRKWQPAPVFLPGKYHGQRNLAGCGPWGCKEVDMTEQLTLSNRLWPPGMDSGTAPTVFHRDASPVSSFHLVHLEDWISGRQPFLSSFTAIVHLYDQVSFPSTWILVFIPKITFQHWSYNPLKAWGSYPILLLPRNIILGPTKNPTLSEPHHL